MRVHIRNPDRYLEVPGPRSVRDLLSELEIDPDTVLVIRDSALVTREERLEDADRVEIRPVISGGSGGAAPPGHGGATEPGERSPLSEGAGGR